MPIEMWKEEQFMRAVLELRDGWFETGKGGDYKTKPFTWIPTRAQIEEWKVSKKVAGQAVQAQAIANGAKKRLDALNDKDQLISQLSIA